MPTTQGSIAGEAGSSGSRRARAGRAPAAGRHGWRLALMLAACCGAALACTGTRFQTNSTRSATEQLLLSDAIERALDTLLLPEVDGKPVAVEVVGLGPGNGAADDLKYVDSAVAERLAGAGARIVPKDEATLVAEVRVGAVGTTARTSQFGLPAISLPPIVTPDIPFIKRSRQRGYVKVRMSTWDTDGRLLDTTGPSLLHTQMDQLDIFFFKIYDQDIYPGRDGFSLE